ncbi:MAG: membrane-associated phospholipid phosphatase [Verrucomicrobiales bacterium]|jgi:membrane-associated phospholipid phosphatase
MRNSWARAWLVAGVLLVAAAAIARRQHDLLLEVEEPVMDWLLDGTDTSIWDRAEVFSASWLVIGGTILLAIVTLFLEKRVALAILITSGLGYALSTFVAGVVSRPAPREGLEAGTFPSTIVVQAGVFWGLVVLVFWWVGAPKLVWQILVELAIILTMVVSIRLIVSGQIWPSDAVGAAIAIAITLITAAIVLEAYPPKLPARKPDTAPATT